MRNFILCLALFGAAAAVAADIVPWLGTWAFELPDGNPAWLEVRAEDGELAGSLLWSVGSARPLDSIALEGDTLTFSRKLSWRPGGEDVEMVVTGPITATLKNGRMLLTVPHQERGGEAVEVLRLEGKKMPPMPPAPDLSKVKFGEPIVLFNGENLDGWRLTNPKKTNGWRAEDGVLINETPKTDFGAYGSYGNLRTDADFKDFQLDIEYNAAAGANSGVYLRGLYEAQVVDRDSRMQGIQGPGAIFGRIAPTENAANPPGEWNHYRLTLVDRHVTVELNGKKVIDNQPLAGCTGGGISADDTAPGPIFLQGDHTSIKYRNILLRPVVE